jgi:hypothetical protein
MKKKMKKKKKKKEKKKNQPRIFTDPPGFDLEITNSNKKSASIRENPRR